MISRFSTPAQIKKDLTEAAAGRLRAAISTLLAVQPADEDGDGAGVMAQAMGGAGQDAQLDLTMGGVSQGPGGVEDATWTYDSGNRLSSKGSTRYEYDPQGRLTRKIEDADSEEPKIWSYEWDALDKLRSVTRPDGQIWRYRRDCGRIAKAADEVRFNSAVREKPDRQRHCQSPTWVRSPSPRCAPPG